MAMNKIENEMLTYELETGILGFREIPNDGNPFNTGITANNPIPEGFELLGIFSKLKEEDVKEVMPSILGRYKNYTAKSYNEISISSALESIHSLSQHLGLNAVNPYGDYFDELDYGGDKHNPTFDQWQQAQSKVKEYFVVFKVKEK